MEVVHATALANFLNLAGISFNSKVLLKQAFTHSSFLNENMGKVAGVLKCNEKLEFLGDAVLGLFITKRLYQLAEEPEQLLSLGDIAKMKAWVVSEVVLAKCADSMELSPCLLLGRGENANGGRQRQAILADTLEAVLGAYYLDTSLDLVESFVLRLFEPYIQESLRVQHCFDYKSLLQKYLQKKYHNLPIYRLIKQEGYEHEQLFVMEVCFDGRSQGKGFGSNKKEAEQQAAREACLQEGILLED